MSPNCRREHRTALDVATHSGGKYPESSCSETWRRRSALNKPVKALALVSLDAWQSGGKRDETSGWRERDGRTPIGGKLATRD
jgi:hypothetical protein